MEQDVLEQSELHNLQLPPTCGQDWQAAVLKAKHRSSSIKLLFWHFFFSFFFVFHTWLVPGSIFLSVWIKADHFTPQKGNKLIVQESDGKDVWQCVKNFTTPPNILKEYLFQRCFSLNTDFRQILSSKGKWNPMSISVGLYYDFIGLNGRNRRTLDLVRRLLKAAPGSPLLLCCTHMYGQLICSIYLTVPTDNI